MSLLLEALKKAEKAKEEAQRRTQGEPSPRELKLQDDAPAVPPGAPAAQGPGPGALARDAERTNAAAERGVFQAKRKEPSRVLPFYITMGFLGAFAVGTVVYFWYQLRPPSPFVNTSPPPSGAPSPVVAGAPASAAAPATEPATAQTAIPGLPGAAPATAPEASSRIPEPTSPPTNPASRAAEPAAKPPPAA